MLKLLGSKQARPAEVISKQRSEERASWSRSALTSRDLDWIDQLLLQKVVSQGVRTEPKLVLALAFVLFVLFCFYYLSIYLFIYLLFHRGICVTRGQSLLLFFFSPPPLTMNDLFE